MLRLASRGVASRSVCAPLRAAAARRALCTEFGGPPSAIYNDKHVSQPDQVLEETTTGYPAGLPQIRESELWKQGAEETLVGAAPRAHALTAFHAPPRAPRPVLPPSRR